MIQERFQEIADAYPKLRVAIVGDFCLDRYFEIDPARAEVSIETGLEVHNVTRVRTQPGAAGTILNNLVALGVGEIVPIGFCGTDGEGWLLEQALQARERVSLEYFLKTEERRTFTYSKPLVLEEGKAPRELNRLDQKNWTPTPASVSEALIASIRSMVDQVDAIIVMDQVDLAGTGVVTNDVLQCLGEVAEALPDLPIIADSRQGLAHYPPLSFKMNGSELQRMVKAASELSAEEIEQAIGKMARQNKRPGFVTLAERGVIGADADGVVVSAESYPVSGEIDIVGAGDSVTANLTAALAAGAHVLEAMEFAMAGASVVVHQLGTTGTASCPQIAARMGFVEFD